MRSSSHVNHGYNDEFLDSDRVANVYFTSDVDAKSRISSLNEFSKINLNEIIRAGAHDDGVFHECKLYIVLVLVIAKIVATNTKYKPPWKLEVQYCTSPSKFFNLTF